MQSKFDLKPQVWFQIKIAWHEVQSQLYYSHFEIVEFSQYQYLIGLVAVLLEKKNSPDELGNQVLPNLQLANVIGSNWTAESVR